MDLVDLIEKKRFVGREFLIWMWFESELFEGQIEVPGYGTFELFLESTITLVQEKEQSRLKGAAPALAPEAHEALRQGKFPTQARVRVTRGEFEYAFLFNADALAMSAVKIPAQVKEETDEQFYERMYLIEELETLMGALYGQFAALRVSQAWEAQVAPVIRAWVKGGEAVDEAAYRKARAKVLPLGHEKAAKPRSEGAPITALAVA